MGDSIADKLADEYHQSERQSWSRQQDGGRGNGGGGGGCLLLLIPFLGALASVSLMELA